MKICNSILLSYFILFSSIDIYSAEYNIITYGAIPDTSKLSTKAIQKTIDFCAFNGGGRVIIPAGSFKTGTIILRSNINLYLEPGANLYGSKNINDYQKIHPGFISLRTQDSTVQLIYAENISNVIISGFGEINGQGGGFIPKPDDEGITRPHLIRFIHCQDVRVENLTLKNSACWMQHYLACERVILHGLRIFNRVNKNNDALDLDGCHDVNVSDIISDTEDDGITLKSTSGWMCENITVTNCIVSSRWHAIKMGTETNAGFKNICISNCVVKPSKYLQWCDGTTSEPLCGIALMITDGGIMQSILISNISIDSSESPIYIRLANRARSFQRGMQVNKIGTLRDISIDNVRITNAGITGCSITGLPGHPLENLRFSNISIDFKGGGGKKDAMKLIAEDPKAYPTPETWSILPAYGFFIRHVKNISFSGIELRTHSEDLRPAFYLDDVKVASLINMQLQSSLENEACIYLSQTKDAIIQGNSINGGAVNFVKVVGENTSDIDIIGNILRLVKHVFTAEPGCKGNINENCNLQ